MIPKKSQSKFLNDLSFPSKPLLILLLQAYLSKLSIDQKKIYEELTVVKSKQKINNNNDLTADNMNGLVMIHGRKMSSSAMSNGFSNSGSSWFEYGAIDDGIIEKLRDEEDVRVRLTGAILLLLKMEL